MKKIIGYAVFFGVICCALNAQAEIREGQWAMEMTIKMGGADEQMAQMEADMANMSDEEKAMMQQMMGGMGMNMGGGGMKINKSQCITNANPVPEQDNQENCQSTHTINGNTINFETTCDNGHSTGAITYEGDTMTGTIQSTTTERGQEESVTIEIAGNYEGPCAE